MKTKILLFALTFLTTTLFAQWTNHVIDETLDGANVVSIADINADNTPDVVAGGYYANDLVWYEGSSWNKNFIDPMLPKSPTDLAVTDLDGDNDLDVVVVLNFQGLSQILWFEAPSWTKHVITSLSSSYIYNKIDVADINGDDIPDVASADNDNDRVLWFEGPSWTAHYVDTDLEQANNVFIADMNNDNNPDIVATGAWKDYIVWYEAPSWTKHFIEESLDNLRCITIADLNNDGLPDVCAATNYADTDVVVWYEAPGWTMHYIDDNRSYSSDLCVADFNNDNVPDVLLSASNANEIVWYEAPSWTRHVVDEDITKPGDVDVADMDGDNDVDIVVAESTLDKVLWYENGLITGMEPPGNANKPFGLSGNHPNPFRNLTVISYSLKADGLVNLKVFDINGKEITTLVSQKQSAGEHKVTFDARGVPAGVYYYRIVVGNYFQTKKMIIN